MKTSALILALGALLLSSGCVTRQQMRNQVDLAKWTENKRCQQDLDRVAAECADSTAEDAPATAPIFGRGVFGQ